MNWAFRIAFAYLVMSLIWITLSDQALFLLDEGSGVFMLVSTLKGYLFVSISSALLFFLLYRNNHRLLKKQQRLSDVQRLARVGGWEYLVDRRAFRLSPELQNVLQIYSEHEYTNEELLWNYIHPDDLADVKHALQQTIAGTADMQIVHRLLLPDGSVRYVRESGKPEYENGKPALIRGTFQDITETVKLEDTLRESNEENKRLGGIMSKVKNLIVITDTGGRITWVNPSFEERTGYTLAEVAGRYPGEMLRGPETSEEAAARIEHAVMNKVYCLVEIVNYTRQGEKYWVEISCTPVFNERKEHTGFIAIQNDITDRKLAEERLHSHNKTLKEVVWLTSHEIRRPVASIMALNELINSTTAIAEKEEYFEMLNACAQDLNTIIMQINKKAHLSTKA